MDIQNSIPPILRLPNELLAEIAAARLDEAARHNGFREVFLEFGLSHVCQRFRQTLLGTSAFWTTFTVNVYREGSVNLSRLYLERSATRDIRLSLAALDGVGASSLVHLIPHASRISRLFVAYVSPQALSEVLAPFEGVALPRLEHVKFSNDGGRGDEPGRIFHGIKTQALILTHLYFEINSSYEPNGGISSKSLTHMHLEFVDEGDEALLSGLAFCDTPALTHLTLHETHGDQISMLFNATEYPVFPSLTSLVFISGGSDKCKEDSNIVFDPIASPPLKLFPALSSLTLIGQCFTARILSGTLGPESTPWPLLRTVTVRPLPGDVDEVYAALQGVLQWKRQRQEPLPAFRLSQNLFARGFWQEVGVDVELLDDPEVSELLVLQAKH